MEDDGGTQMDTVVGLALGAVGAVVGLLPWLVTGARLPLQNLWQEQVLPDRMPLALLPVSQYFVVTIVALLVVGGLVAGLLGRRRVRAERGATPVLVGLAVVQLLAVLQSLAVVREGLGLGEGVADDRASLYWWAMLGGTLVAVALSVLVAWLVSRPAPVPAALGLVLVAVPSASWVAAWSTATPGPLGLVGVVPQLVRWTPAVVVVVALVWCGLGSARRVAVWAVALLMLVALPPVVTAVTTALGTRVLQGDLRETVTVAGEVLRAAADTGLVPAVVALALSAAIVGARAARRRTAAATA